MLIPQSVRLPLRHVREALRLFMSTRHDEGWVVAWYAFWSYLSMWPEVRDARVDGASE